MQQTTPAATDPKRRYLCRHVFTEGHRCGSPALRGKDLCYNHSRARREAPISGRSGTFPMPRIDDRAAIQLALFEVLSRLSGGDIDTNAAASSSTAFRSPPPTSPATPPKPTPNNSPRSTKSPTTSTSET